ncbi:hypothetical protein DNC80_02830 [Flavobacterium sp. SOK18b]|uniref:helix-turn-helix domain-containing protein n=1 Tax=Flavobacterium sp. SOK18b TaxID=797900 RepID=UPI0015FE5170|nr:helix-turn-helix domain-containing protein [Flavobacterium sp. SOK18b]MBB1192602.1 hypothetical protein [Flavobacterium sp. SOK18b]
MKNVNYGYNEAQPVETLTNKKGGRPTLKQTILQKAKALELYKMDLTQKEIGEKLGITEKTIGKWSKEWKQAQTIETTTLANLKNRLLAMSIDKTTPIVDIKNLILVIQQLETK